MIPVKIDCQNLRLERQRENNQIMFRALITQDIDLVRYHCNNNELQRVLTELNEMFRYDGQLLTLEHLLLKCNDDKMYAMALAGRISIKASRQGTKDESYILGKCNQTVSQIGIEIKNLSTTEFRPTKDGRILTNKQYKKSGLKKSDCLKSFDAQITGKVNGWVFAKVAFGTGGHQDNVFIEAHEFGKWVLTHGQINILYVMLIDTDLILQFEELKQKFFLCPNILVCDHFEFQQFLLTYFSAQN